MATPFKRVCCQGARYTCQRITCSRRRADFTQWRSLSITVTRLQADVADSPSDESSNPFLTPFPRGQQAVEANVDPTYEDDDISSLGHKQLDQHHELREMVRIAAWEMPLLANLHKPFLPPDRTQLPLKWRYTTYMGESHPAASKVVVEFDPMHLTELNHDQRMKFLKLVGTRFDPVKKRVKMSCESFEAQAQNKRYLGDTIQSLIAEAKDPTDTFQDLPLDTRHAKRRPNNTFPAAWRLTEERKLELEGLRRKQLLEEGSRVENERLVSGAASIEQARQIELKRLEKPMMAEARQPLPGGKMGKKEMGQQRVQR